MLYDCCSMCFVIGILTGCIFVAFIFNVHLPKRIYFLLVKILRFILVYFRLLWLIALLIVLFVVCFEHWDKAICFSPLNGYSVMLLVFFGLCLAPVVSECGLANMKISFEKICDTDVLVAKLDGKLSCLPDCNEKTENVYLKKRLHNLEKQEA